MNKTIEERAKEYATGMMGLGEYSERWHHNDKMLFNTIVKAAKYGMSEREEWKRVEGVPQEWEIVIDKVLNWRNYRHEGLIEHLKERYTITPKPTP